MDVVVEDKKLVEHLLGLGRATLSMWYVKEIT